MVIVKAGETERAGPFADPAPDDADAIRLTFWPSPNTGKTGTEQEQ